VDAVILITNRMAQENEGDDVWIQRTQYLIDHIAPHVKLGLYECPYPYKRLMSEKTIRWCINTGRFYFLKDTSSDIDNLKMKLNICAESKLKLYNANTATLLDSLHLGAYGYCGVMANIHPRLYNILYDNRNNRAVQELSEFLTISALIERQCYPLNAKYYLQLEGVPIELKSRLQETKALTKTYKKEVEMLKELSDIVEIEWGIKHEKKDI